MYFTNGAEVVNSLMTSYGQAIQILLFLKLGNLGIWVPQAEVTNRCSLRLNHMNAWQKGRTPDGCGTPYAKLSGGKQPTLYPVQ